MNVATLFENAGNYNDYSGADAAASAGLILFAMVMLLLFVAVVYAVHAYLLSRIFHKAGVETWKAWVPVYNNWVLLELGDQKGYWAILAFVPFVNIVSAIFMYIAYHNIGLKLGKEGAFVLLAIFIPIVWYIWLAFDSSQWQGAPQVATEPTAQA